MIILLYVAGILALSIFVSWWFILALLLPAFKLPVLLRRARVLKVLALEFQYEFAAAAPQAHTLNRMERETRSRKLRDEELATLFMAVMISSLLDADDDVKAFARRVHDNASRLLGQGAISQAAYSELDEVVQQKVGRAA